MFFLQGGGGGLHCSDIYTVYCMFPFKVYDLPCLNIDSFIIVHNLTTYHLNHSLCQASDSCIRVDSCALEHNDWSNLSRVDERLVGLARGEGRGSRRVPAVAQLWEGGASSSTSALLQKRKKIQPQGE